MEAIDESEKINERISIIVVDDSDFTRKNIIKFLRAKNFNVTADFNHAKPALDYLAANNTNIALIDVVMPDVSGIELTQKIATNINRTKVILMSSLSQERIILEAIAAGAQDFLPKPISEQHLEDTILRIMEDK
jgi:DNA-binding NarL/FixJ family response regulator